MEIENININSNVDQPIEIIVREGEAPRNPPTIKGFNAFGDIGAPAKFYVSKKEAEEYVSLWRVSHVIADKNEGQINLYINELIADKKITISGKIQNDSILSCMEINADRYYSPKDLSDLIRKNRSLFEDKNEALRITTFFRNFKASIDTQLASEDDQRGNRKELIDQKVASEGMPKSFQLSWPTVVGEEPFSFEVDIFAKVSNDGVIFTLDSIELLEHRREIKSNMTDKALKIFEEDGFAIFYE